MPLSHSTVAALGLAGVLLLTGCSKTTTEEDRKAVNDLSPLRQKALKKGKGPLSFKTEVPPAKKG